MLLFAPALSACDEGYDFFNLEDGDTPGEPATDGPATSPSASQAPIVVQLQRSEIPSIPDGLKISCPVAPDDNTPAWGCPVIRWNDVSYWALSYVDNRYAIRVVAFDDASGAILETFDRQDVRYIYDIVVDEDERRVELRGQSDYWARIRWSALAID